jgi:1-deoxy-D-xylulose-5-phosphate synthase
MQYLATSGLFDAGLKIRPMILPDRFIEHDTPVKQYEDAGLAARGIVATALAALGADSASRPAGARR